MQDSLKMFVLKAIIVVVLLHISMAFTLIEIKYVSKLIRADIASEYYNRSEDAAENDGEYMRSEWLRNIHFDNNVYIL